MDGRRARALAWTGPLFAVLLVLGVLVLLARERTPLRDPHRVERRGERPMAERL